jgi:hypothetical protein
MERRIIPIASRRRVAFAFLAEETLLSGPARE